MRVLQHNDHGYVGFDPSSACYEVAFHTSLLRLDDAGMRSFGCALEERLSQHHDRVCRRAKLFILDNGDPSIRIALRFSEMETLYDMIEEAMITRAVDEIMDGA